MMRRSDNGNGTFTNPVIFADYPDPDIIRVGDDFYLASSSFTDAPGVPVCHSRDLVNWRIIGHAYDRLPETNPVILMAGGKVMYRAGAGRRASGITMAFSISASTCRRRDSSCAPPPGPEGPYEMTWFGGREFYDPALFFDDR